MWKDGAKLITVCYSHCKLLVSINYKEAYFYAHLTHVDIPTTLNCSENHKLSHYARFVILNINERISYKILMYFLSDLYRNFDISNGSLLITVILKARYTRKISWDYSMLCSPKCNWTKVSHFLRSLCANKFQDFLISNASVTLILEAHTAAILKLLIMGD